MIEFQQVTKLYGSVIGVNDITMSLPAGGYGLLGPNGSGKTTLLNLLIGQLRPTLGNVRVLGDNPCGSARLMRKLGYCPATDGLDPQTTALDWVTYMLQLGGQRRSAAKKLARETLQQVGLAEAMHRPMGGYSRGMRQRTKLAQSIAKRPELLILDEPFNGLDPVARHELTELLIGWLKSGKSLILASHVLHEIEAITDSFLLICGGRLLASGSADEVSTLLADVPNEVRFRCSDPRKLACLLADQTGVQSIRLLDSAQHLGDGLLVATKNPAELYHSLPALLHETKIDIYEMHSSDDSLQEIFDKLLKIHRGELV